MQDELKQLRITTWLNACFQVAGSTSLGVLFEKTGVSSGEWSRYKSGYKDGAKKEGVELEKRVYSPSESTVKRVGIDLPNTAPVFFHGIGGLPLWAVLDGNLEVCNEVLNKCLLAHMNKPMSWMMLSKKVVPNMTLKEKCQALLEGSIPSSWFEKPSDGVPDDFNEFWWADEDNPPKKIDLRFTNTESLYFNLSEIIIIDKNFIAKAYGKSNKNKSVKLGSTIINHVGEFKIARPQNLIAFLAAAVLCVINSKMQGDGELADIAFFFFSGLEEAIKKEFGEDIFNYIEEYWNL